MKTRAMVAWFAGVALIALAAAGCSDDEADGGPTYRDDPKALNIVAGSEQDKVLRTVVQPWCDEHGYSCAFTLKGSVDQARLLAAGERNYDAYWFASTVFLQVGDRANTLQDVKPMFLTPIVYAGWRSEMDKLGFTGRPDVGIADILTAVESGKTTVWVTNPTQSNSGATVLLGFMNHFAGNGPGQALTQQQLDSPAVDEGITRFIRAMDHTPPSTGTMMNECLAHADVCRTMFTYEDLVIEKNQELVAAGREPLYTVYPRGSLAISDAPLGLPPARQRIRCRQAQGTRRAAELPAHRPRRAGEAARARASPGQQHRPVTVQSRPDRLQPGLGHRREPARAGHPVPGGAGDPVRAWTATRPTTACPSTRSTASTAAVRWPTTAAGPASRRPAHQIFDQDQAALNFLQTHPEDRTTVGHLQHRTGRRAARGRSRATTPGSSARSRSGSSTTTPAAEPTCTRA